jgi:hypothetical protein
MGYVALHPSYTFADGVGWVERERNPSSWNILSQHNGVQPFSIFFIETGLDLVPSISDI